MVTLDRIRTDLGKKLEEDKNLHFVEVRADTLEEALADASLQLNCNIKHLEYELLEPGFAGVLGLMKKPWFIRAYQNPEEAKKAALNKNQTAIDTDSDIENDVPVDKDGVYYIHYFSSQINLKVIPPEGNGIPVQLSEVLSMLKRSDTQFIEEDTVRKLVVSGTDGKYVPVGQFEHNMASDALISVDISNDEMKATITVTSPAIGGAEISPEQIARVLQTQGVVAGISQEKIDQFVDMPIYGVPCIVAEAVQPVNGRDAYIAYNFETDRSKLKLNEAANGQVNFKELNLIQNVVEGQPLATKMPPERGKAGKTIRGRYLEAKNGKDIPMPLGKNVGIDNDGRTIIAKSNGQVMLIGDKIHVEPIMELDGVSIKSGNIKFNGTVIVKGDVEDGYEVRASGNIEVYGRVGKSVLESDGDIIVSLGIQGGDEGRVKAGKSLWAKFINNTKVDVEEYVVVTEGIMNSDVTCNKKILLLQGKKAAIIGGHLFATEEIYAKTIGSSGGGETVLEVGYDPRAKKRLDELLEKQGALTKELDELDLNITTLEDYKEKRKKLPHEKEENLKASIIRKAEIEKETAGMTEEILKIQGYLRELKVIGKVSASGTVYAGVKITVRDVKEEIRNDTKNVTFYLENGFVRHGKYEPPTAEDLKRTPEGYSN